MTNALLNDDISTFRWFHLQLLAVGCQICWNAYFSKQFGQRRILDTVFFNVEYISAGYCGVLWWSSSNCSLNHHHVNTSGSGRFVNGSWVSCDSVSVQHEVDLSRKECPFVIKPKIQRPSTAAETEDMDTDMDCEFPLINALFPVCITWNFECTTCPILRHCYGRWIHWYKVYGATYLFIHLF